MKWELINKASTDKKNLLVGALKNKLARIEGGNFLILKPDTLRKETDYKLTFTVKDAKFTIDLTTK